MVFRRLKREVCRWDALDCCSVMGIASVRTQCLETLGAASCSHGLSSVRMILGPLVSLVQVANNVGSDRYVLHSESMVPIHHTNNRLTMIPP
jgi:hypothetical protein